MRSIGPALALGNAVVLKTDPNTPSCGGVLIARIFEEAGLPDGCAARAPRRRRGRAGAGRGSRTSDDLVHRLDRGRPRSSARLAGRELKRVVLELGGNSPLIVLEDADIERRVVRRRVGLVPAPGPDLPGRRAGTSCTSRSPRTTSRRSPSAPSALPVGDPATRRRSRSGRSSTQRQVDARPADRRRERRGRRARRSPAARTTACSTRRPCSRDVTPEMPAFARGDLRPGRPGHDVPRRRRGGRARQRDRVRALGRGPVRRRRRARRPSPRACTPGWSTSTTRRSTRSRRRRSAASASRATAATSAASANLELWTEWQWVTSREKAEPFPF